MNGKNHKWVVKIENILNIRLTFFILMQYDTRSERPFYRKYEFMQEILRDGADNSGNGNRPDHSADPSGPNSA
jgi:hypothetical protein